MARLIKANGQTMDVEPKNGTDFLYDELQGFVDGYIETVCLNDTQILVVNEDGKIHGLPYNNKATELMRSHIKTNDFIVGDALLCNTSQVK